MKFNKITKLDEQIYRLHPISKKLAHLPKYKKKRSFTHINLHYGSTWVWALGTRNNGPIEVESYVG